jgi:hypothetical protein
MHDEIRLSWRRSTTAFFPSPRFSRGEGWVTGCFRKIADRDTRGDSPSPGLLRNPTSPRIRLRQKAGFGGQELGEATELARRPKQLKAVMRCGLPLKRLGRPAAYP